MESEERKNVHDELDDLLATSDRDYTTRDDCADNYDSNANPDAVPSKSKKKRKRNKKKKNKGEGNEGSANGNLQNLRMAKDDILLETTPLKYKLGDSL